MTRADAAVPTTRFATVFGVDWRSSLPLIGFAADGAVSERHHVPVLEASPRELRVGWEGSETVACHRFARGRPMLVVERTPDAYRIRAVRHGVLTVAADGRTVWCAPPYGGDWRWQRLLYAHALPLAAQLQGVNLLHASAVRVRDAAVAFVAASGTGKSTTAANLVARGHGFLTDDVLAVSNSRPTLIAHAGPPLLGLSPDDYDRLPAERRATLGPTIGRLDKLYLATPVLRDSAPLQLVYLLTRGEGRALDIREHDPPPAGPLLGGAFLSYLQTERRLVGHLDFCAALAARTRVFTARMPSTLSPERVAVQLEAHIVKAAPG